MLSLGMLSVVLATISDQTEIDTTARRLSQTVEDELLPRDRSQNTDESVNSSYNASVDPNATVAAGIEQDVVPKTRYPIVLCHGLWGYDYLFLIGGRAFAPYFRGIQELYEASGIPVVIPRVSASGKIEVRATELARHIFPDPDESTAETATKLVCTEGFDPRSYTGKYNIIAHSMGGLDARYLITRLGLADRVASLTTVSTPHRGAPVADLVVRVLDLGVGSEAERFTVEKLVAGLGLGVDALRNLTTDYIGREFNPGVPDHPAVRYFAFNGRKHLHPLHPYYIPWKITQMAEGDNDGLVSLKSARWGEHTAILEDMDHLEEIGFPINNKHLAVYREIAKHLAREGL